MAGNNAIGSAALVLSANANGLVSGLNKAEALTRKSADKMSKTFSDTFKGSFAGAFGGSAIGGSIGSKIIDALADGGLKILGKITGISDKMRAAKFATEDLARANDELARSFDRTARSADEFVAALTDPKAKGAALERLISQTEGLLDTEKTLAEKARKELRTLDDDLSGAALESRLLFELDTDKARLTEQLRSADEATVKLGERLKDLREQKMRVLEPSKDPAIIGEVNRLTDSLKLSRDTFGMTGNQAQIFALKAKGATDAQLEQARKLADELDALDKRSKEAATPKLTGAFERGSREAFSIVAKFQTQNQVQQDTARKQLAAAEKLPPLMAQMVQKLANAPVLRVI